MDSDDNIRAASSNFSIDELDDDNDFFRPFPSTDEPASYVGTDLSGFHNRVTIFDSGWCSGSEWRNRCSNNYTMRIFVVLCVCVFLISLVVAAVSGNYVGDADKSQGYVTMVAFCVIFMIGSLILLIVLIRRIYFASQVEEF